MTYQEQVLEKIKELNLDLRVPEEDVKNYLKEGTYPTTLDVLNSGLRDIMGTGDTYEDPRAGDMHVCLHITDDGRVIDNWIKVKTKNTL